MKFYISTPYSYLWENNLIEKVYYCYSFYKNIALYFISTKCFTKQQFLKQCYMKGKVSL